jgi:hypothetical protein
VNLLQVITHLDHLPSNKVKAAAVSLGSFRLNSTNLLHLKLT